MVQNLKVDVIYHQTPSDFEMEFNLCGCCRMRLLNDKTTDKKSFIKALARDVSRSRVIIGCGPLFGDEGLIKLVAKAIGNGVSLCQNKTYGINSDDDIYIIDGSTPLVTPDGYFGGCIIESGPQTIILLTENRAFRKSIMQNLIHPYIEEISYIPTTTTSASLKERDVVPKTAVTETENYITQPEDDYDSSLEDASYAVADSVSDQHNIAFVMDEEESAQPEEVKDAVDSAYNDMYTEIEHPDDIKARYEEPYVPSDSDNMFIFESSDDEDGKDRNKTNSHAMDITIIVLVLLLLLSILALVYFVVLRPMTMGVSVGDYIKQIFGIAGNSSLV